MRRSRGALEGGGGWVVVEEGEGLRIDEESDTPWSSEVVEKSARYGLADVK